MLIGVKTLHEKYLPDLSERMIYDLARSGQIPSVKIGRKYMFDATDVVATLKASGGAKVSP